MVRYKSITSLSRTAHLDIKSIGIGGVRVQVFSPDEFWREVVALKAGFTPCGLNLGAEVNCFGENLAVVGVDCRCQHVVIAFQNPPFKLAL